ncbi:MAG: tail fiber domain-containing protein [Betaproteobacteria bacterium]|nr:tail fiber domain-containing protein [Betaproteobacteria bacterium]
MFVGSRESSYAIIPYDFSGTTFYPAGPIVRTGGTGAGPSTTDFGTVAHIPNIITGFGYLSGYRSAAHNGASCVIAHPAYPEGFGRNLYAGSTTQPATSNGKGRGQIIIYRYTLTSVFRGNSLFEGYVKCDNLTVGSSGGSVDHARIKFGGRKGENTTEAATTIESRWLGTHDAVYTGSTSATGYKHDNELLISKFYSELHTPYGDTVSDADWNKRDFFGDRVRIKAPKIEFQIQSPQSQQGNQKYRESPCVSITDMNNPFGGERGMTYETNPLAAEPRQLVSIRTGTSNSRVQAGLRLIAGSSAMWGTSGTFDGNTATALTSAIPSDGDMYTFAPGNDGWLRLLCPVGQGQSVTYQTETNPQNTSQTITSNYAGMAVGNLYVGGSISGPGAPSGSNLPLTGSITGTYGSVETTGGGASGWKGYSINGEWVFMTNYTEAGIYNDIDNKWAVLCTRNSSVRLAYNGSTKLQTTIGGVAVLGSVSANNVGGPSDDRIKYNEEDVINCLGIVKQLRPLKYEKLVEPEDAVGTWIPTDDEWESVKNDYNWNDEYGFIAQDVRNIPGLDILVNGDETEEIEIIKTELEYNEFSEEMRANYTYRPDTNDYRHNDSGETQKPLTLNYIGIIPILTGAVQELSSDLEQEKQKTENLQTRLTASEQAYQSLLERVVALENA